MQTSSLLKSLFLLIVCVGTRTAYADNLYPVFTIPEALKTNAYAVVRLHETTFTVKSAGEAVEKTHMVVTILNEKGKNQAKVGVLYDQLTKVNYLEGSLYDAFGKQVKKLKKSDIQDISLNSNGQLIEDRRAKVAEFTYVQYPYTVEFEYEVTQHNMLFYPRWQPQDDDEVSIEKASLTVNMPEAMELRYKEINLPKGVTITPNSTGKQYVWQVAGLTTFKWEDYAPTEYPQQVPIVYTAATNFEIDGYKGSMRSWSDLSKFFYELNDGRDVLPENIKQKVSQLIANEKDPVQKIKKLYEYMQSSTRYVGIQLGIGGWQTMTATEVATKGYGDCKALSNYMKALLKVAGIPAYCTSVMAGEDEISMLTDFPNPRFNHVILCVPQVQDTIWLECTEQNFPFGYQGSFTGNRYALIEAPTGGKLVRTTQYSARDNTKSRTAMVQLDINGDARSEIITHYHGERQDNWSKAIDELGGDDLKKYLYSQITIPSFEIDKFSFQTTKKCIPVITEKLSLTVRKCGSKSGTRMFITPNLMNVSSNIPQKAENRKSDFVLSNSYMDIDTVVYQIPKGYGVEFVPEAVKIESKFGNYQASSAATETEITYIRAITVNRGHYPPSAYNEWVDFRKKIVKADKTQLVLVNKGL